MTLANLLQIFGAICIGIGLFLLYPWLGIATWGLLILIGGVVMELEARDGSG